MKKGVKLMALMVVMSALLLGTAQSGSAAPVDENGISKSINQISVQGDFGYFSLKEGFEVPQMFDVCYIDLTTSSGRIMYGTLLAMKTSDLKVTRLVYDNAADGTCRVKLLQTQ
jgi:hypothetical protein